MLAISKGILYNRNIKIEMRRPRRLFHQLKMKVNTDTLEVRVLPMVFG